MTAEVSSIRELAEQIRSKQLSPVALTEACLEKLEKTGAKLGAVVTITRDQALREAKAAEAEIAQGNYRGLLHGIPYGAKDLLATKGIPTTWGAAPFKNQVFDEDATVIRKLRDAGAILVAKLAMVELAGGLGYNTADASFTGPGRTPWNLNFWAGGSSAGSGAAVAAGLVPFAIGSETSGSIICPSAFCGITGLRPTYGRVSRHGAMALCWTLDKLGPMCRSADDCGIVLAVIAGPDPLDPTTLPQPFRYEKPAAGQRFKIGVIKGCCQKVQPEVKKNFLESIRVLRGFCDVVEDVPFPDFPIDPVVDTIVAAEGASAFRDFVESGKQRELQAPQDRWGGFYALQIPAVDYLQAMRIREPMKLAFEKLYAPFDALLAPSMSSVAFPIGKDFDKAYPDIADDPSVIPAGNAVGQPALSVPNGFGANNLPTGIQFTGKVGGEAQLLAVAHAYQQATDWHTKLPPAL
jgi:aspartyl-tRNA(Asn)/glutamyl-tRNA(Gln) amidotransferase subunit A